MPYSAKHKAETHARIVGRASARFRQRGLHGVGVAELMQDAGLTHGGFYAHFRSREALVDEAVQHALDETMARFRAVATGAAKDDSLASVVAEYLSAHHRDSRETGCAIAALGAEIAREPAAVRRGFRQKLERVITRTAVHWVGASEPEARRMAIGLIATMVGAMIMARAVDRRPLSDEILRLAREFLLDARPGAATPNPPRGRVRRLRA